MCDSGQLVLLKSDWMIVILKRKVKIKKNRGRKQNITTGGLYVFFTMDESLRMHKLKYTKYGEGAQIVVVVSLTFSCRDPSRVTFSLSQLMASWQWVFSPGDPIK